MLREKSLSVGWSHGWVALREGLRAVAARRLVLAVVPPVLLLQSLVVRFGRMSESFAVHAATKPLSMLLKAWGMSR